MSEGPDQCDLDRASLLEAAASGDARAFGGVYRLALWLTTASALVPALLIALLGRRSLFGPKRFGSNRRNNV